MKRLHRLSSGCVLLGAADCLLADRVVDVRTREQFVAAVRAAGPGTTIRLAPGKYRGGMTFECTGGGSAIDSSGEGRLPTPNRQPGSRCWGEVRPT